MIKEVMKKRNRELKVNQCPYWITEKCICNHPYIQRSKKTLEFKDEKTN
jgi:hypothetical protein